MFSNPGCSCDDSVAAAAAATTTTIGWNEQTHSIRWQYGQGPSEDFTNVRRNVGADYELCYMDAENPAAEDDCEPIPLSQLSIDDQIKAYEARQRQLITVLPPSSMLQQTQHRLDTTRLHTPQYHQEPQQQQQQQQNPLSGQYQRLTSVRFAEEALLYGSDRTEDEVFDMWYNRSELEIFKAERKSMVKALKKFHFDLNAVEHTGLYCLRGYEPYFSVEVNKATKYARTFVLSLVIQEQERQRKEGIYYDPVAMEQAVTSASVWARENALQLGRNDEIEAFDEYARSFQEDPYDSNDNENCKDSHNDFCYNAYDYDGTVTTAITNSTSTYAQEESYHYGIQQQENDNTELSSIISEKYGDEFTTVSSPNSLLGKRKDVIEQPTFTSRPHVEQKEDEQEETEIAERFDSALKLLAALKSDSKSCCCSPTNTASTNK